VHLGEDCGNREWVVDVLFARFAFLPLMGTLRKTVGGDDLLYLIITEVLT
jgi:hypothetical protein